MKQLCDLWPELVSFENLWLAWRKARRGKSRSAGALQFGLNLERELFTLQEQLEEGTYQPGEYRLFTLYERKPRVIAAAPFRDRVVHHAIMNVIEPPLDRTFIHDSYACRRDKGTHGAVDRYQQWARRYPYVLKLDIQRYFPSIDHELLKEKLARQIGDTRVLELLDRIIDSSPAYQQLTPSFPPERPCGIPIGNLTSQFFANFYLSDFDHWVKEQLHAPTYLRYVDDMVLLGTDKHILHDYKSHITGQLENIRLCIHPRKAHVSRTGDGLNFLGYIVFLQHRRLRNDNGLRFRRKLRDFVRAYHSGRCTEDAIRPSIDAWLGHARHANTVGLRRTLFRAIKAG